MTSTAARSKAKESWKAKNPYATAIQMRAKALARVRIDLKNQIVEFQKLEHECTQLVEALELIDAKLTFLQRYKN